MRSLRLLPFAVLPILFGGSCLSRSTAKVSSAVAPHAHSHARASVSAQSPGPDIESATLLAGASEGRGVIISPPSPRAAAPIISREKLHQLVRLWIADEPEAALAYLAQLPDAALRAQLLSVGLRHWAATDIASASDWATRHGASPTERTFLLRETICGLAATDPAEALLWFALMTPDVRTHFDGSENIRWETYLRQSPADAAARIPELPAGVLKNQLASAFALTLATTDRLAAQIWAEDLADSSARRAALAALRPS